MGTRPGAKFTEEHKKNLHAAQMKSAKWWAGRKSASEKLKGRSPTPEAIAGSLASRKLGRMGLTKETAPDLWKQYFQMYLDAHLARRGGDGQKA